MAKWGESSSRPARRQTQKRKKRSPALFVGLVLVLGLAGFGIWRILIAPALDTDNYGTGSKSTLETQLPEWAVVSLVAVGDNLPDIAIGSYADACAGELGDGLYNYSPIYAPLKPYIEAADLAYVCFETHAGGDAIGPRGWPSFNVTDTMVDALYDTGFNLIASATNHSYDWGLDALVHSASLWEQKDVLFAGTAISAEDAAVIKIIERNGIVFSLLSYTYGVNAYTEADIPAYAVNWMDEDRIPSDIARARAVSDVVLVAMHWGTEMLTEADPTQQYFAQLIADAGADVILGSHTHVIGPVSWLEGANGHKTLVAYSLGNFLSDHDYPELLNDLGGMLSCDFVKTATGVKIMNVAWTPLVMHAADGAFAIYALPDYTPELAAANSIMSSLDDPIGWLEASTIEIVGPAVAVKS